MFLTSLHVISKLISPLRSETSGPIVGWTVRERDQQPSYTSIRGVWQVAFENDRVLQCGTGPKHQAVLQSGAGSPPGRCTDTCSALVVREIPDQRLTAVTSHREGDAKLVSICFEPGIFFLGFGVPAAGFKLFEIQSDCVQESAVSS